MVALGFLANMCIFIKNEWFLENVRFHFFFHFQFHFLCMFFLFSSVCDAPNQNENVRNKPCFFMKILMFARKTKVIRKAPPTNTTKYYKRMNTTSNKNETNRKTWRKNEKRAFSENHAFLMKIHIFARKTRATGTRKTWKSILAKSMHGHTKEVPPTTAEDENAEMWIWYNIYIYLYIFYIFSYIY